MRVGEGYSEESEVKVGGHQGSVLSPLPFMIVRSSTLDLYASYVIIAESLRECVRRLFTDPERSNGGEKIESKCRKDKGHDLWYGTGSPADFRRVPMRSLSHWSGQQQHLLQCLQALGAQEKLWAQVFDRGP